MSSGLRINKASDDAAGLAISDTLRADARVYLQGIRNLNDGLSLLNIADSAIEQLTGITIRLTELAEQASNGAYSNTQRKALDAEAQALSKEYFRIARTTNFNGLNLFDGSTDQVHLQAGYGLNGGIASGLGGALGTGTFDTPIQYATETYDSYGITLGDLNGDGILDMVSSGYTDAPGDGFATVRLGLGGGTFGTAISYASEGWYSSGVRLGDLNGDGILDLVTAGRTDLTDGYSTVRLGRGDGTFGTATSYTSETAYSTDLALGDVNNDGFLDIVTSGSSDGSDGYATVRLGRGDGSFGSAASYSTENGNQSYVELGDVNNDGILDLVTAGATDTNDGYATIRLGLGDGTFGSATSYTTESQISFGIELGDLNGDGILDIVTSGRSDSSDGYATVRLGIGDGTFGAATSYFNEGNASYDVKLGDLNGDGFLDLVTAGRADVADGYATIRFGLGDGSFGAATSFGTESARSEAIALGDLNGDGVLDLVTAGTTDGSDGFATIRISMTKNGIQPLLPFSLTSLADARQALPVFQQKRDQLTSQRSIIGAFQSRIDVAVNVLQVSAENFRAAESRIRDTDTADDSSHLVRLNILQKAASAVLAQANQLPALALKLLT